MNLKKDALFNTVGNFFYLGTLWLMSVLVVRLGDFEKAGYFSIALTTSNIYISLASYTVRLYYAADINKKFLDCQYVLMRLITTASSFLLCIIGSFLIGYSKTEITIIILFYLFKSIEMISDVLFGSLQRCGKLYLSGYSLIVKSIASLILFSAVMYLTKSLVWSIIAIDCCAIAVLLFIDIPTCKKEKIMLFRFSKLDLRAAIKIIKICFPLFLVGLCYNIVPSIPRLSFERIYSAEEYGIYSSISTLTVLISTAVTCVTVPFVPKYAQYYRDNNRKLLKQITYRSNMLVMILGGVTWLFAGICGEWVLTLLFGPELKGYGSILQWVIIAVVLTSIIICLNNFFVAVDKQHVLLYGCIPGTIICILAANPLNKMFYMNGVAYNLILSQGVEIIILFFGVCNILNKMKKK